MMGKYMRISYFLAATCTLLSTPALAETTDSAPISVSADIGVVSDYRFRGVSLSDNDFAVQGGVTVNTQQGFYAGGWASSIAEYGGAKTEIDLSAGWSGALGPVTADVNVVGYLYPNGTGVSYYELNGSLSKDFGAFSTKAGLSYSPKQDNLGAVDNTYVYGDVNVPVPGTPVSFNAHVGHENGVYQGKTDFGLGANFTIDRFTLGVSYIAVDSDPADQLDDLAKDRALVSLKATF